MATPSDNPIIIPPPNHFPSHQAISIKLTESNYLLWKQQVLASMRGYGLESFLTGEKECPPKYTSDSTEINPDFLSWNKQDQLIVSWLLASLTEEILISTVGFNTSQEIWKSLETNFASQSRAKIMQYRSQLQGIRKGTMGMREYLNKIKGCCDVLNASGHFVSNEDQILYILSGLGQEYNPVVVSVSSKVDPISVGDVSALLLSFEARLECASTPSFSTDGSGPSVYFTQQSNNKNISQKKGNNNTGSGQRGGRAPFRGGNVRGRGGRTNGPRCQICFRGNHTAEKCYYRQDLNYTPPSNNRSFPPSANVANSYEARDSFTDASSWFLDSGANSHVTYDLSNLNVGSEYQGTERVHLGNGSGLNISHLGSSVMTDSNKHSFLLKNLLHVPHIKKNLLSVSRFASDNKVYFEFHPDFCLVKDQLTHRILLKGTLDHGLYKFSLLTSKKNSCSSPSHVSDASPKRPSVSLAMVNTASTSKKSVPLTTWHNRLGHASFSITRKALDRCHVSYLDDVNNTLCTACMMGKSHKLPFPISESNASVPFQVIHSDLWGPSPIKSHNGFCYYVNFVDEATRYTWIYLLKLKSDVKEAFIHFKNLITNQYNAHTQIFHSDNGTEYKSLTPLFHELGIIHRFSCPYTPEQNGRAERKHRHIVETALTLLNHAHVPLKHWDDAFITSTYLINRMPSVVLNNKTPYELLTGHLPNYSHLKVFGCLCFPYLKPYNNHKLEPKSQSCVFLGYNPVYKGYKVLLPNKKLIITRHVLFYENVFPFHENPSVPTTETVTSQQFLSPLFLILYPFLQIHNLIQTHKSPLIPLQLYPVPLLLILTPLLLLFLCLKGSYI